LNDLTVIAGGAFPVHGSGGGRLHGSGALTYRTEKADFHGS